MQHYSIKKHIKKNSFLYLYLPLLILLISCSNESSQKGIVYQPSKIFGGERVGDKTLAEKVISNRLRIAVGLVYTQKGDKKKKISCSGVLLDPMTVITAAHCLDYEELIEDPRLLEVYVGNKFYYRHNPTTYKVQDFVIYPDYRPDSEEQVMENDIALVFLEDPIPNISFLELPLELTEEDNELYQVDKDVVVVGFGKTNIYPNNNPNIERGIQEKYFAMTKITEVLLDKSEMIIGEENVGPCHGDSGGPVIAKLSNDHWKIIGITSRRKFQQCAQYAGNSVITMISPYSCWIKKTVAHYFSEDQDVVFNVEDDPFDCD